MIGFYIFPVYYLSLKKHISVYISKNEVKAYVSESDTDHIISTLKKEGHFEPALLKCLTEGQTPKRLEELLIRTIVSNGIKEIQRTCTLPSGDAQRISALVKQQPLLLDNLYKTLNESDLSILRAWINGTPYKKICIEQEIKPQQLPQIFEDICWKIQFAIGM